MDSSDWTLIRWLFAVAEAGSLSAAARVTRHSQPTLGCHIKALERGLGCALFLRTASGQELTDAELHDRAPGIGVELVATDTTDNLLFAEAEIALRMYRPTQPDLITRHLGDLPMQLYAARGLLDRMGQPADTDALLAMPFVGFDRNDMILRLMASFGVQRTRRDFAFRCDDQLVHWNLACAGCGVGGMLAVIGDADQRVRAVAPVVSLLPLPMCITTSAPLAQNARLSLDWDHLATALRRLVA